MNLGSRPDMSVATCAADDHHFSPNVARTLIQSIDGEKESVEREQCRI